MKNQKIDSVRSPLHYNGNKFSLLNQIIPIISTRKFKTIIEPFGGTGIVSLNSDADMVIINDTNIELIKLLKYFKNIKNKDIEQLVMLTEKYGLTSDMNSLSSKRINNGTKGYSLLNKEGYLKLKSDYLKEKNDIKKLFLLSNYSFNRMIRFNTNGQFNVPVGKGDFSKKQATYLINFAKRLNDKNVEFSSKDFESVEIPKNCNKKDILFYFDPPYLNGNAQYNTNWTTTEEERLYKHIDKLNDMGVKFCLSNTLFLNGMKNEILFNWMSKYNVIIVEKKYSKTNYNKKERYDAQEVLVTNI